MPGTTAGTVQHLYLNQILPLALSRRGKLVLHASAIDIGGIGVAFLGASGKGKSTLAASFATSGQRFLTDDGLVVEKGCGDWWIAPSHPSIRLWEDSHRALIPKGSVKGPSVQYTSKVRILAKRTVSFCREPRRLRRLYFLGDGNVQRPVIRPIPAARAVIELVRNSFLLDIEEKMVIAAHFTELTELAARRVCFRLDYPRTYAALPIVRQAIIAHALSAEVVP